MKELIDLHGLNEERLIKITGKKKSTIINSLRILNLPMKVIEYIKEGKISRGHALALPFLKNRDYFRWQKKLLRKS